MSPYYKFTFRYQKKKRKSKQITVFTSLIVLGICITKYNHKISRPKFVQKKKANNHLYIKIQTNKV